MAVNIPDTGQKRVVIAGGGFAGLKLASKLINSEFQVVLIDRNNYHQFQPLFYQVATAGLEPSAISFPFRKVFQKRENVIIRIAEVTGVDAGNKILRTSLGDIRYDFLVIAMGADTNFFGMNQISEHAIPMKSVSEALSLRNHILQNFEESVTCNDLTTLEQLLTIVVVGGGPTGVEVSGTLAEMRRYILPKDYPELDFTRMKIYLFEAGTRLLNGMSDSSSRKARNYLEKLGVLVRTNAQVSSYDGKTVTIHDGKVITTGTLVWAAGITGNILEGMPADSLSRGNRIKVDRFSQVTGVSNIFALGDIACMSEPSYPGGHPQMAQPAIQQARLLARNLKKMESGMPLSEFHYIYKGAMATVGRNLAVVDFPLFRFHGFLAWLTWMFVHLMAIVGVKNRLLIFINWFWNYVTYDQSLRLIIRPFKKGTQ